MLAELAGRGLVTEVLHMVSHVRRRFSSFLEQASISSPLAMIYWMDLEACISEVVACCRFTHLLCVLVASGIQLQLLITKSI